MNTRLRGPPSRAVGKNQHARRRAAANEYRLGSLLPAQQDGGVLRWSKQQQQTAAAACPHKTNLSGFLHLEEPPSDCRIPSTGSPLYDLRNPPEYRTSRPTIAFAGLPSSERKAHRRRPGRARPRRPPPTRAARPRAHFFLFQAHVGKVCV